MFIYFDSLNDDIQKTIFSFVADAPLELKLKGPIGRGYLPSSLGTTLPLVNKSFQRMAEHEIYWEQALLRQLNGKERGHHWVDGVRKFLPHGNPYDDNHHGGKLIQLVKQRLADISLKSMYKTLVMQHIKFEAPVFIMPCQLQLGEMYGLHLFEPRYRIMVRELLGTCENLTEAQNGGKIIPGTRNGMVQPPVLIHACLGSGLDAGEMACLVELVWCRTYDYGTADVQLLPVTWVQLEKVWVRPSSGHLFYAKAQRV